MKRHLAYKINNNLEKLNITYRSQGWEKGRQKDTNISNFDGNMEKVEDMVDDSGGDHEPGVDCAPDDST